MKRFPFILSLLLFAFVSTEAQNIQFQAYMDYGGNAATDGFYYGDVKVELQAI
jgi:hypothetical protein